MSVREILRITRLMNRYGMAAAQAAMVAGLIWGDE